MIYQFPTLYSRRSDGGINQWTIEVEGSRYRTISGILNGSLVSSEWTVAEPTNWGKVNARSAEEQAHFEAQAKWTKKKNEKYTEDINAVDTDRIYQCMLAKEFSDHENKLFDKNGNAMQPLGAQPKLDGIRSNAMSNGLWSRKGKLIVSVPHIWEALQPLFDEYPDLILDGELYADKLSNDFQKICSIVRKQKPTDADYIEALQAEYHVYDLPSFDGGFSARYNELSRLVDSLNSPYVKRVETHWVYRKNELDALYTKWLNEGYEGQMVRLDKPYENKRSATLLKRKEFMDAEFIIDDILEGSGNKSGMAGFIKLAYLDGTPVIGENGEQSKASLIGSWDYCRNLLKNRHNIVGTIGTVEFFGYGKTGAPRFPRLKALRDYE